MAGIGDKWRFWLPVGLLSLLAVYSSQKLIRSHVDPDVTAPNYTFRRKLPGRRGAIYSTGRDPLTRSVPFAKSVPCWEYSFDPVDLTNHVAKPSPKEPPRSKEAIVRTIADALKLDYHQLLAKAVAPPKSGWRSQRLAISSDPDSNRILSDSRMVTGVAISDRQIRQYLHGRFLSHVLGSINAEDVGSAGIEQRFNRELSGTPGTILGMRDAKGRELYDKRKVSIDPVPGADVYLTIDHNIQFEAEDALRWGVKEYGAGSGWCIVMDATTGAVLAMVSLPDFHPLEYGRISDNERINRAIAFTYEPGSVMKVITAASAIDAGFVRPTTVYRTNRDDDRYYRLPGDGSHVWEPTMTVKDAIVHSSNIVIGKLGYDFGSKRLYTYMRRFGFGEKTGIELPGEEVGILPDPGKHPWDKASCSRAPIGQFVSVTGIQLISAYQAIANDGLRMKPYIVDHVTAADGRELYRSHPTPAGRAISPAAARTMRQVMLGVATPKGTARRAAIRGFSVAGKTGTAQKHIPGIKGYAPGLYRASFCGIVPATDPRLVILVTLDFDQATKFHQGGNSAGPVFKRIAMPVLRYLMIAPDQPAELDDQTEEDEYDKIFEERTRKYDIISSN